MPGRVAVGVDGSTFSSAAEAWARDEAALHGAELQVLGPYDDDAATRLVADARGADLLVVGSAGTGSPDSLGTKLGAVAASVIRTSPCPVVIVPPGRRPRRFRRLVIGVDGTATSTEALHWAACEAVLREAELVVVHAWWHARGDGSLDAAQSRDLARSDAQRVLEVATSAGRAHGATVRPTLVEDGAARAILGLADDADLVVVGSRGSRGRRAMLYGSVAQAVIERAPCPVVSWAAPETEAQLRSA